MDSLFHFLQNDEIYSPIAFIVFGVLTLLMATSLKKFRAHNLKTGHLNDSRVMEMLSRFENRSQISWVLLCVGILWLCQLIVEKAWAT